MPRPPLLLPSVPSTLDPSTLDPSPHATALASPPPSHLSHALSSHHLLLPPLPPPPPPSSSSVTCSSLRSSPPFLSAPPLIPSSSSPPPPPLTLSHSPPSPPPCCPPGSEGPGGFSERLLGSTSVWRVSQLDPEQVARGLEREAAGVFLVHCRGDQATLLSVRLPNGRGEAAMHNIPVKEYGKFLHLEGSCLLFDNIIKLISFYCFSRDILPVTLRLPKVITIAKKEELSVVSAMAKEFCTMALPLHDGETNEPPAAQPQFCHVVPNVVERLTHSDSVWGESPVLSTASSRAADEAAPRPASVVPLPLQRAPLCPQGDAPPAQPHSLPNGTTVPPPDAMGQSNKLRFKRPPPRPPSLCAGSPAGPPCGAAGGAGPPGGVASPSAVGEEARFEELLKEARKTEPPLSPPPPSRPPVPWQARPPPCQPPAPPRRASPNTAPGGGAEGPMGEEGEGAGQEQRASGSPTIGDLLQLEAPAHSSQTDGRTTEEREEEGGKEREEEEGGLSTTSPSLPSQSSCKRPPRPVPPPRRKQAPKPPEPAGGAGLTANQCAAVRAAPPSSVRRPDVSLYSPQGGAAVGADPDSCSPSSSEEDPGEVGHGEEHNQSQRSDSHASSKAAVKRTPTTVMLGRARHRLSSVLTGLMSHDVRLTQRIVELARDPISYFGNLVKEHRTFTLETMTRHSSTTELLQEIRTMMTQLKSYLLQSTELQGMLEPQHQYTHDKLESIAEAALCKSVLKPLRESIYLRLETLHSEDGSTQRLVHNQSSVLGSTTTALGVTTAVPEAPAMEKINVKLCSLHLEYSPQRKIQLLLKTCKIIYDSMAVSSPGRAHGADDFLPVMMYVLARSKLAQLRLDVEYMMELMDPSLSLGEGSYYLTTTYGALEHIKTFDQQRAATRQLSREVQDSINRWERRRTLNKDRMSQGSVQDFLTVCCPEVGSNPRALGVLPGTSIHELTAQCASRFEQDSYIISLFMDGLMRPLAPTELALGVKNSLPPGGYCFVFHPAHLIADIQTDIVPPVDPKQVLDSDGPGETGNQDDTKSVVTLDDAIQEQAGESLITL
ncbi:ras and Rab interactor 3 isoform X1 [Gadus morhua]|uniref:Ras and Rab interactor 3 n=2 Tax=Gadus morhua TaxID=8049 RepID=A0A8C4ZR32_GADMO|nr:ras and Rab interactor 3-like isoform X1 [Gadus morhua]